MIANHQAARLSELDHRIAEAVPPGGNWKDIPVSIPSKRLEGIRASYARGEGSRSTYYGRLHPDRPSYTITTYFNRPGNGCHLHYSAARVLSQREAARFQSFPDSFAFSGGQGSVNTQIGNAVPPLAAYQLADALGAPGGYLDLFAGAGGLGLGFHWAGWEAILANDIDPTFLATHSSGIPGPVLAGSIEDPAVQARIVQAAEDYRATHPGRPLWIVGGPPCQGFSTAGARRTMEEPRNHLFRSYERMLEGVKPDGFLFENVTGLLNMQKGETYREVKRTFESQLNHVSGHVMDVSRLGVPQRRKRVVLLGTRSEQNTTHERIDRLLSQTDISAPSAVDAISDLPEIASGEDGSHLPYGSAPRNDFQRLARGLISPAVYLAQRALVIPTKV